VRHLAIDEIPIDFLSSTLPSGPFDRVTRSIRTPVGEGRPGPSTPAMMDL
jgi:hypothetical protein